MMNYNQKLRSKTFMVRHFRSALKVASLALVVFFSIQSCELITPDAYIEAESRISTFDSRACNFMTRDFIYIDTVFSGTDTSIVNDTLYHAIEAYSNDYTVLFDSLVFEANSSDIAQLGSLFDSIVTGSGVVLTDTTNLVGFNGTSEYLYFPNTSGGTFTVFVSWAFTGKNVSDYVTVDFINESGSPANILTLDMPLETISGCTVEYLANEETGAISDSPAIKTRTSFDLESTPYLMRVTRTQFIAGTEEVPLYIALLQND